MRLRPNAYRWAGLSLTLFAASCGGGGGGTTAIDGGGGTPVVPTVVHATPTLALTAAMAPEIAAQSVAVLTSLRDLSYEFLIDTNNLSLGNPTSSTICMGTGSISYTYLDDDHSGTVTPGDRVVIAAPGCEIAAFGNGSATATVLATDDSGAVDLRLVIEGGTLPYLRGWDWLPTLTGTLRVTLIAEEVWVRSEGALVFTFDAQKSFRASNLTARLRNDTSNDPPAHGIMGGLDIAFDTPVGAGGRLALDTDGLIAGEAPNVAPSPGSIVLRGAGGSGMHIADAKPESPGWYLVTTDADGDGVEEARATISYRDLFNAI